MAPDPPRERTCFFPVDLRPTPHPATALRASSCGRRSYRRREGTGEEKMAKEAWGAGTAKFFLLFFPFNYCCKYISDLL
jgi:hypothetical protein